MLKLTALIIGEVHSKPSSNLDVASLLQSLQAQLQLDQLEKSASEEQLEDDEEEVYGTLRSDEVEQLINLAKDDNDNTYNNQYRTNDGENQRNTESQLLQQLSLLKNLQEKPSKLKKVKNSKVSKNVLSKSLLGLNNQNLLNLNNKDNDDDDENDLERNYSNIYLVLNPEAVEKSQNKDKLNDLLTDLLQPNQKKENRYKGFMIKKYDILNRRRLINRDEDIYVKDSMESNHKKRNRERGERGGGGGGGGGGGSGRTAIPYIGHRGDIYERDN